MWQSVRKACRYQQKKGCSSGTAAACACSKKEKRLVSNSVEIDSRRNVSAAEFFLTRATRITHILQRRGGVKL